MEKESVYNLALKCADRQLTSMEFSNLYKEFFNEKFSSLIQEEEETVPTTITNIDTRKESPLTDTSNGRTVASADATHLDEALDIVCSDFVKILNLEKPLILADYIVEVLFVNYNSDMIKCFLPKVNSITNSLILVHFFSKSCSFFAKLSDTLIIDQVRKDLGSVIVPNILSLDMNALNKELIVSISKLLQIVLKLSPAPILLNSVSCKNGSFTLLNHLSQTNKLLFRKISKTFEAKLNFKDTKPFLNKDSTSEFVGSPSLASPQYIPSPLSSTKPPGSFNSATKYKDMKFLRYYKNIWLNNKVINWEIANANFLPKYSAISPSILHEGVSSVPNLDQLLSDLIETSFTCFAQFVSNKQYHQANSNLTLLERKWVIFITKHLPLLILENSSRNPRVVINALDNIDEKVIKAIRIYFTEKDDIKSTNEDLFDDYPSTSLDIRHDFIKGLIMLNLQPASVINNYLREDQMIDTSILPTSDDLVVRNLQGIQEVVHNTSSFIISSLDTLELESITGSNTHDSSNGLFQVLHNFESVAPTKQREIVKAMLSIFDDAIKGLNYNRITKICALLFFNFSHSLTTILSFSSPTTLMETLIRFIDSSKNNRSGSNLNDESSEYETVNISLSFSWAILLLINLKETYGVSVVDVALKSSDLTVKDSFIINFISNLPNVSDKYYLEESNINDSDMLTKSHNTVQSWLCDLFVNGSITDQLMQNIETRQLASLIPFIVKQVLLSVEIGALTDISSLIGGFEYFLQPLLLIGLIKTFYWLEQFLSCVKDDTISEDILQEIFNLLNTLFNPVTLNEDSKAFHTAVLRLNAIPLLKVLRKFRVQSQSNYGIYSSDAQGDPNLEPLIAKLISVLNVSPVYDVDPRIINSENDYSRKQLGYGKFLILNENPINKIMTNQINSFWSLHSSTYYNLDYLFELIELVTPKSFLFDVLKTLEYKLTTYGVPGSKNKRGSLESEHVFDYFFYFLVLRDVKTAEEATQLINYMEYDAKKGNKDVDIKSEGLQEKEEIIDVKQETQPKNEIAQDDDFDMLFGENDTSTQAYEEEEENEKDNNDRANDVSMIKAEEGPTKANNVALLKRDSFAVLLHEMKLLNDLALEDGEITKKEHEKFIIYHDKYLCMLKRCVF
ncbi:nut1p [Saccharomyces arboricola H-6]|uniref:Mediator of RNA polymerase II transcription subunit 5 n=1 Tax=Saccharomyces arboricola (strain H-6 / AS 2.3317 / CBS 10644) TaxID=1160507 RepID=J8LNY2_SACAR|nr:nut1p [Saccharomyces arboricola H-6]